MTTFIRLTDYKNSEKKEEEFFNPTNHFKAAPENFEKIPGLPIAYWISQSTLDIFQNAKKIRDFFQPCTGLQTGDNTRFIKKWFEVSIQDTNILDGIKWFMLNNGGEYRKWFGNFEDVLMWEDNGRTIKQHSSSVIRNEIYYYQSGITWNRIATDGLNMRYLPNNFIFDQAGDSLFFKKEHPNWQYYLLAFFNTKVAFNIMAILSPTLNLTAGGISDFPIIFPKSDSIIQAINIATEKSVNFSREEWDSRETSWDFTRNELLKHKTDGKIETAYAAYCDYWKAKFFQLHANEEELNRLFIDIYALQDELTPDVALEDITILKAEADIVDGELVFNADEIMRQFISYAVGVMFGRYSLDSEGLVVANMNQAIPTDTTFAIDDDNVIPVLEDDYFSDDIVSRFIQFVKITFGEEHLNANIRFIEKALGKTIRAYFVKDFCPDHIKRYKKRPIYWMVSSPKKGFNALLYMHRYQSDIFARVRNNYLHEYATKLEAHKEILEQTIVSQSVSDKEKKEADKQIKKIDTKLKEIRSFDRDHLTRYAQNGIDIDLDDGVKVNYCKFEEILHPITGLCK